MTWVWHNSLYNKLDNSIHVLANIHVSWEWSQSITIIWIIFIKSKSKVQKCVLRWVLIMCTLLYNFPHLKCPSVQPICRWPTPNCSGSPMSIQFVQRIETAFQDIFILKCTCATYVERTCLLLGGGNFGAFAYMLNKSACELGMGACASNPSPQEAEAGRVTFEDILYYIAVSGHPELWDPVSTQPRVTTVVLHCIKFPKNMNQIEILQEFYCMYRPTILGILWRWNT